MASGQTGNRRNEEQSKGSGNTACPFHAYVRLICLNAVDSTDVEFFL